MNQIMRLTDLKKGETGAVRSLDTQGSMRRRLLDMGLIQGTLVECVGVSPLGDPAAYLIRGAVVALRGSDASGIAVDPVRALSESSCAARNARALLGNASRSATME